MPSSTVHITFLDWRPPGAGPPDGGDRPGMIGQAYRARGETTWLERPSESCSVLGLFEHWTRATLFPKAFSVRTRTRRAVS